VNPFWEKAIQGAIILGALASDTVLGRLEHHAWIPARPSTAAR
jgi:ribose/xylose/arabinose/galactoside ABC-type transport system permease subunit